MSLLYISYFLALTDYDMDDIPTYEEVELFQPVAGRYRPVVLIGTILLLSCCLSTNSLFVNKLHFFLNNFSHSYSLFQKAS